MARVEEQKGARERGEAAAWKGSVKAAIRIFFLDEILDHIR
jgi:hypothetical protein